MKKCEACGGGNVRYFIRWIKERTEIEERGGLFGLRRRKILRFINRGYKVLFYTDHEGSFICESHEPIVVVVALVEGLTVNGIPLLPDTATAVTFGDKITLLGGAYFKVQPRE